MDFEEPDCTFCRSLPGVGLNPITAPSAPVDQILSVGPHVVLTPTLGTLVPGYLMVVTGENLTSMGALGPSRLPALESWLTSRLSQLEPVFGKYLVFEHGSGKSRRDAPSGACIIHAHLHLVPANDALITSLRQALAWRPLASFSDLASFADRNYTFLESEAGMFIETGIDLPGQWIRRQVARSIGRSGQYDWGVFSGEEELQETLSRMPQFAAR